MVSEKFHSNITESIGIDFGDKFFKMSQKKKGNAFKSSKMAIWKCQ